MLTKPFTGQHKKSHDSVDLEKESVTVEQAKRVNCLFVDKNIANNIKAIFGV